MNAARIIYKFIRIFVATVFLLCCFVKLYSQKKIIGINNNFSTYPIGKYVYLFKDQQSFYKDVEVINLSQFKLQTKEIPVMDVPNGDIWARFTIVNQTKDSTLFLDLQYSNISRIFFYKRYGNRLGLIDTAGNDLRFDKKINTGTDFVFPFILPSGDTTEFFLKIRSKHPILLPLFIKTKEKLDETTNIQDLIFGLYFGIILSILLYNLFLFISTKDLSYLFYIIYLFFLGAAQTTVSGYGFKYFWPNLPVINLYALPITTAIAAITGILFAIFFLRIAYYYRNLIFLLSVILLLYFIAIIASISGNNSFSYNIINYGTITAGILLIIISALIGKKGYKAAYFYLFAWSSVLAGIIILVLRNFSILPYTTFTTYASYIGSALEAILLSIALADRINTLRKEKEESQAYALQISRENEKLIREQNIVLEQKVAERT